jgi:hypothetical protein
MARGKMKRKINEMLIFQNAPPLVKEKFHLITRPSDTLENFKMPHPW